MVRHLSRRATSNAVRDASAGTVREGYKIMHYKTGVRLKRMRGASWINRTREDRLDEANRDFTSRVVTARSARRGIRRR
jgi:hypothetical protein